MMVGVPLAATGFLVWALLVDSYITFLLVYVGAVGFGINMGFFHPALAVANNWFIRKRATAMAIVGVSLGVGGAVLVPLLGYSIETLGWRTTAALAGIAGFVIIWPVTLRCIILGTKGAVAGRYPGFPQPAGKWRPAARPDSPERLRGA
jgi:MFS family permease